MGKDLNPKPLDYQLTGYLSRGCGNVIPLWSLHRDRVLGLDIKVCTLNPEQDLGSEVQGLGFPHICWVAVRGSNWVITRKPYQRIFYPYMTT